MNHLPPDPRFRSLVAAALALAACTGGKAAAPEPAPAGASEGRTLQAPGPAMGSCEEAPGPSIVSDLNPSSAVDAVAVAVKNPRRESGVELMPATGPVCGEGSACVEPLLTEALRTDCGQIGCVESSVVWTGAGQAGAATSRAALLAFLGPIDTAGEARLVAWADQYRPTACDVGQGPDGSFTVTVTRRVSDCPITTDAYDLSITASGEVTVAEHRPGTPSNACIGRIPAGLTSVPETGATVGAWLARAAHLEAASVHAFRQLHTELVHHGAPASLCEAALACLSDEVRHAQLVGELARAAGAEALEPEVTPTPVRCLVAIARDNAVEGCGREAWGAVVGAWQGQHAAEPSIRAVMADVADDELRHAEFSLALDAWIRTRLTATEQRRVDRAGSKARRRFAAEALAPVPVEIREALGLPDPAQAAALWQVLGEEPLATC